MLLMMKTYKLKILRCSKLIRDKAIGQPCGSICFDQIWFSINPGAINRLAAQIAKELGETEAKLKWVRSFIITKESSLDVLKKWVKFDKQWIIIGCHCQKYTRYKSLCLGLLGQLKKMHIQLPMLYVVKVLASSPHNFVLLLKLGVPIRKCLTVYQAGRLRHSFGFSLYLVPICSALFNVFSLYFSCFSPEQSLHYIDSFGRQRDGTDVGEGPL